MSREGVEFGSHTMTHQLLNKIAERDVVSEIEEAKRAIENLLQKPCWTFAYPAGFVTEVAQRAIERAGHTGAFSTVYGPEDRIDLFALNRIEVLRRDRLPFKFARKVAPLR